jgi:hypothetical protein
MLRKSAPFLPTLLEVAMSSSPNLDQIHDAAINNRHTIEVSTRCGCFSCEAMFHGWEVTDYTERDFSAICPRCQIDSVLPERLPGGAELNQALLRSMRVRYFESAAA